MIVTTSTLIVDACCLDACAEESVKGCTEVLSTGLALRKPAGSGCSIRTELYRSREAKQGVKSCLVVLGRKLR